MNKNEISLFLMRRRFRRRLKSKSKKEQRNRRRSIDLKVEKKYREIASRIKSYQDALNQFLPRNLSHLIYEEKSPFCVKKLKKEKYKDIIILEVPKNFSVLENEKESYSFLQRIVSILIFQSCKDLWLDYEHCKNIDLLTQVFLDSILLDIDKFITTCERAKVDKYLNVRSIGGKNMRERKVRRLLNSVGSPAVLINRNVSYDGVKPYRLKCFDGNSVNPKTYMVQKEIDTTTLLEYVNDCLAKVHKTLTTDALKYLGYVIGETIINAEEHSSLHYRYLIGYFEECNEGDKHYGLLNLVIMNFGQTIYEKFKYPLTDTRINDRYVTQMENLSNEYSLLRFLSSLSINQISSLLNRF